MYTGSDRPLNVLSLGYFVVMALALLMLPAAADRDVTDRTAVSS